MLTANKQLKRYSTLLIIRGMQIRTTVRYFFFLIRFLSIKQRKTNVEKDVEKLQHLSTVEENVKCTFAMENNVSSFTKLKIKLRYYPAKNFQISCHLSARTKYIYIYIFLAVLNNPMDTQGISLYTRV